MPPTLTVVPRDAHCISRKDISPNALKVLYRLQNSGYDAYLVGGGVRDLLLGLHPKDFDIATGATPEQVVDLFRNARLIGRRFKLVHVRFGREIIEVATFRGSHDEHPHGVQDDSGRLLRDNVYGSKEEDAVRRDFTVNALFYSVKDFTVHDYVQGLDDIEGRQIRLIGDPEQRYREDPVRMLRAVRFAAKLDFSIAADTAAPIQSLAHLMADVPAARLFDEVLKLLQAGHGEATFDLLRQYGLFRYLFPATDAILNDAEPRLDYDGFIRRALHNTDQRIRGEQSVTPAFLYAALLWPAVVETAADLEDDGESPFAALFEAGQQVLREQARTVSIPRRYQMPIREIWELQHRLTQTRGKRPLRLLEQSRFRAGYDFLLLREDCGHIEPGLGQWWTEFQEQHAGAINPERTTEEPRKRRPRRRRRPASQKAGAPQNDS